MSVYLSQDWSICAVNHSPSARRCCTLASTVKLFMVKPGIYTQMQIFNLISIIKLVSTKQRQQMGFTAAFSLLTHCRSKRYRTLLLHSTYQEVLKAKQYMDERASNDAPNQWAHHWLLKSHTAIVRHITQIQSGLAGILHGLVKRIVSYRPFTENKDKASTLKPEQQQDKKKKKKKSPPEILFQACIQNQLFEQQITHKSTEAWFDNIWFSCEIWL